MCVHPEINLTKGVQLTANCKKAMKGINPCIFFQNRDVAPNMVNWDPLSIEDLHKHAHERTFCPYFLNKDRVQAADLIFMPYNYLIDEKIRENYEVQYANSAILIDEAHNIAQVAEDVASFEIKDSQLKRVVEELAELVEIQSMNADRLYDSKKEDITAISHMTEAFR